MKAWWKRRNLEQFFDDDAVIPSIAIFSYEPAPDGLWAQPGNYAQQMWEAYEVHIGLVKLQQLPADNWDKSNVLREPEQISLDLAEALLDQVSTAYTKRGMM